MFASVGIVAKFDVVWQLAQVAVDDVGMWFDGFMLPVKYAVLVWQTTQSPPVG